MGRIIGIDLGTTNSVGAYWRRRRPKVIENEFGYFTPSVVWIERGHKTVGRAAKNRLMSGSPNIVYSIKRFMGRDYQDDEVQRFLTKSEQNRFRYPCQTRQADNGEIEVLLDGGWYSPVQVSAMILEQIKKDAEITLGEEVTHAVVTVPAYFGQRQKNATREAGQMAGLVVPRIINEPTAAALAFGIDQDEDEPLDILVYDLGGGTFDVSLLSTIGTNSDVMNIAGDNFLGGDDFDNALVNDLLEQIKREQGYDLSDDPIALMRLKEHAERAKIEMSRNSEARILIEQSVSGQPVPIDITVTRDRLENLIANAVQRSISITLAVLEGANLTPDDIDQVLLVGGSTRVPLVRQKLKELFGNKIAIDVDPMQCVALGAAVMTAALTEDELATSAAEQKGLLSSPVIIEKDDGVPEITIQDILSKHIGVETYEGNVDPLLKKGLLYPTDEPHRKEFYTNHVGQTFYRLPLFEAENEDDSRDKWEQIGEIENDKLPPGLPLGAPIMVEMSIDADGVLFVSSFLKSDEANTRIDNSFHFRSEAERLGNQKETVLGELDFGAFLLDRVINMPELSRFLLPGQAETARNLIEEARTVLQAEDVQKATTLSNRIKALVSEFPPPTMDIFWAKFIMSAEQVPVVDRSQTQQILMRMEQSINRGDIDTANIHLRELRQKTEEVETKLPGLRGSLLKSRR